MKYLLGFAEFVRRHYQLIIIATVVVGLAVGFVTAAPGKALQPGTQALTFLMILFISFTITPRQFALVGRQPIGVVTGLVLNLQILTASLFYRYLSRQVCPVSAGGHRGGKPAGSKHSDGAYSRGDG